MNVTASAGYIATGADRHHNKPQNIWIVYHRATGLFSSVKWTILFGKQPDFLQGLKNLTA
jgi:hypothetical protein